MLDQNISKRSMDMLNQNISKRSMDMLDQNISKRSMDMLDQNISKRSKIGSDIQYQATEGYKDRSLRLDIRQFPYSLQLWIKYQLNPQSRTSSIDRVIPLDLFARQEATSTRKVYLILFSTWTGKYIAYLLLTYNNSDFQYLGYRQGSLQLAR